MAHRAANLQENDRSIIASLQIQRSPHNLKAASLLRFWRFSGATNDDADAIDMQAIAIACANGRMDFLIMSIYSNMTSVRRRREVAA